VTVLRDLRLAARSLRKNFGFTLAVSLGLGLALGSTGAIFSLVDGLWLRPLDVPDANRLAWVFQTTQADSTGVWSYPEYERLRDRLSSFSGLAARGRRGVEIADAGGRTELLLINAVSSNFFSTLGVAPLHGRLFAPGDEPWLDGTPAVVLGHAFWQRRYGGAPSVVGRTLDLGRGASRVPATIVGVLPASFRELTPDADRDLWVPLQTWTRLAGPDELAQHEFRWLDLIGRLRDGVSARAASAEAAAATGAVLAEFPGAAVERGARVVSEREFRFEVGGANAAGLLALVLLVVVITGVNVANLMLARTADRAGEFAVRLAIGAERRHLVRHLWTESALLGVLGAGVSLLAAMWLIRILPWLLVPPPGFRAFTVFAVDVRVVVFTVAVTAVTTALFSVAPIAAASRTSVASLLKSGRVSLKGGSAARVGKGLVVAQVAVSMVLVSSAAVLGRSFIATRNADLGFGRHPVLTAWIPMLASQPLAKTAAERLRALPGVEDVAVAVRAPLSLSGGGMARQVLVPGAETGRGATPTDVKFNAVDGRYFAVMGTRVLEGRVFADDDGAEAAVVNDQFARTFFSGRSAIGGLVRVIGAAPKDVRVVGVVENSAISSIGEAPEPYMYLPFWSGEYGELTFLIGTRGDIPADLGGLVSSTLAALDRSLEPRRTIAMSQYIQFSAATYQATAALALALAAIGLLMTAFGVYGVIAYRTSRRAKEIGIRMALGAARGQVIGMVLREGVRVGALGMAFGIPAALAATTLLRSMLFGVHPWDGPAFVAGAVILSAAIGLAALVPALRAARLTPSRALRES
jgi:putative ABC transport system permease protein